MKKCPKCKAESHWRDWDYVTSKDLGVEIPSLGLDTGDFKYKCPECDEYSSREHIKEEG